jgi:hypothetical protein
MDRVVEAMDCGGMVRVLERDRDGRTGIGMGMGMEGIVARAAVAVGRRASWHADERRRH